MPVVRQRPVDERQQALALAPPFHSPKQRGTLSTSEGGLTPLAIGN